MTLPPRWKRTSKIELKHPSGALVVRLERDQYSAFGPLGSFDEVSMGRLNLGVFRSAELALKACKAAGAN